MTARPHLSALEWLGFELAAARHLDLDPGQVRILISLLRRAPNIVTHEQIRIASSPPGVDSDHHGENVSKVRVCNLRKKLLSRQHSSQHVHHIRASIQDTGSPGGIENIWGRGYRMSAEHAAALMAHVLDSVEPSAERAA